MLKKIARGYKKLFSSTGKIILLAILCLALAFIFVWPLWKWAMISPETYSWILIALIAVLAGFGIYKSIKNTGIISFLQKTSKILVILAGVFFCIFFVLKGHRLISLVILIADFIIYGILAFGIKDKKQN